jgi:hypothetical protein
MIHYTLLPEKEIKKLKMEYRIRLFIFLIFFLSCSVFVGIISLIPAYYFSFTQEKEVLTNINNLQKGRQDRGTNTILSELAESNKIIKTLKSQPKNISYSDTISQIVHQKSAGVSINSFSITTIGTTTTATTNVVINGKASTRDVLIKFKNNLESTASVSKVELPISDLAKNKDISFSVKVTLITKL